MSRLDPATVRTTLDAIGDGDGSVKERLVAQLHDELRFLASRLLDGEAPARRSRRRP